jgi:hypothetical protein
MLVKAASRNQLGGGFWGQCAHLVGIAGGWRDAMLRTSSAPNHTIQLDAREQAIRSHATRKRAAGSSAARRCTRSEPIAPDYRFRTSITPSPTVTIAISTRSSA